MTSTLFSSHHWNQPCNYIFLQCFCRNGLKLVLQQHCRPDHHAGKEISDFSELWSLCFSYLHHHRYTNIGKVEYFLAHKSPPLHAWFCHPSNCRTTLGCHIFNAIKHFFTEPFPNSIRVALSISTIFCDPFPVLEGTRTASGMTNNFKKSCHWLFLFFPTIMAFPLLTAAIRKSGSPTLNFHFVSALIMPVELEYFAALSL